MKKTICRAALAVLALVLTTAGLADEKVTLEVPARYYGDTALRGVKLTLTPTGPLPRTHYTNIYSRQPLERYAPTNGSPTYFSNVLWGYYTLALPGQPPTYFNIEVGTNLSGVVPIAAVVTNSQAMPPDPSTNYYTKAQADALHAAMLLTGGGSSSIKTNGQTLVGAATTIDFVGGAYTTVTGSVSGATATIGVSVGTNYDALNVGELNLTNPVPSDALAPSGGSSDGWVLTIDHGTNKWVESSSGADRVATNAGTIYNGTNAGDFTLTGVLRDEEGNTWLYHGGDQTALKINGFNSLFTQSAGNGDADAFTALYPPGNARALLLTPTNAIFAGQIVGDGSGVSNLLASGVYTGMNKPATGRTVWDFANVTLSQAGALFAADDLSAGGDVIAAGGDVIATGQFIGDAGGLTNWPGLVVTNADATLSGNQLTTGDGGRGIRTTNLTATVLGASSGVPYSATAAQIGGLFSGGSTYLKADGTTGTGGTSGSASTNYFHPDDYGALGDGTTVDDNAVSNAWRAAWTAGGVFSMEGRGKTYVVSNFCFTVVGSSPSTVGFSAPIFRGGGSILRHVGTNWLMRFTNACPDIEGLHVFATGNSPGGILILGPPSNGRLLSTTFYGYTNGTAIMAEGLTSWNVEAWAAYCYRAFGFGAYCDGSEMRLRADHCTFSVDQGCTNAFWQYTPQGPVGGKWTIVGNYNGDCVLTPARGVLEVNAAFESCTNAFIALGHNLARHGYDNTAQGAGTLMLNFAGGFGNPANGGVVPANWTNAPIELNCVGAIIGRGMIYGTGWTNGWFISRNAQADTSALQWEGNFNSFDMRVFMQLSTGERILARNIAQQNRVNLPTRLLQTDPTINANYSFPLFSSVAKYASSAIEAARLGYAEDISGTNFAAGMRIYYSGGTQTQFTNTPVEITSTLTVGGNTTLSALTASRFLSLSSGKVVQTGAASADLSATLTDETGSGAAVFATSPTFPGIITINGITLTNPVAGVLALRQTGASTNASLAASNVFVAGSIQSVNGVNLILGNGFGGGSVTIDTSDFRSTTAGAMALGRTTHPFSSLYLNTLLRVTNSTGNYIEATNNTVKISDNVEMRRVSNNTFFLGIVGAGGLQGDGQTFGLNNATANLTWGNSDPSKIGLYYTAASSSEGKLTLQQADGTGTASLVLAAGGIAFNQLTAPPTNAILASSANNTPWTAWNQTNLGPVFGKTNSTSSAGGFTIHRIAVDSEYLAQLREEFFGGGNASFQIGELGWRNISGGNGTPGAIASEANHPGIFRASTAGSANSYSGFALSQSTSESGFILSDGDGSWTFIFRPSSTNNTDTAVGFAPPATHFIATASPNTLAWNTANICVVSTNGSPWYLHARNAAGGPESWVSTGVASQSAGWVKAKFRWNSANSIMYLSVNDSAEVSASGASLPALSALRSPVFQIITSDTNARDIDADFFWAKQVVTR